MTRHFCRVIARLPGAIITWLLLRPRGAIPGGSYRRRTRRARAKAVYKNSREDCPDKNRTTETRRTKTRMRVGRSSCFVLVVSVPRDVPIRVARKNAAGYAG